MTKETQAWQQSLKQLKLTDKAHQVRKKAREDTERTYKWVLKPQQMWPGWPGADHASDLLERLMAEHLGFSEREND